MERRGVIYDVGTVYAGMGWRVDTRPKLDLRIIHRELEIIQDDLHCNAVRLRGRDVRRLGQVGQDALGQGLELWLSAEAFEETPGGTLRHALAVAAVAERLRQQFGDRVVLIVGSELTLFMRGIVPGRSIEDRARHAMASARAGDRSFNDRLNAVLSRTSQAVRAAFSGPVTYASLAGERVDWAPFDFIGVDHYREARIKERYVGCCSLCWRSTNQWS
jgi:hypothetical protein